MCDVVREMHFPCFLKSRDSAAPTTTSEEKIAQVEKEDDQPAEKASTDSRISPNPARSRGASPVAAKEDPNLVTWENEDVPQNPKNWGMKRKWAVRTPTLCTRRPHY